jgi:Rrf2 family protein
VLKDGVHDVVNDQIHRTVAARLVLFFEEIGKGAVILPEPQAAPTARSVRSRRSAPLHVSARVDYALRAVAELIGAGTEPMRCETVAQARGIPLNSLVNLMVELRRAGLVRSQRGCEGGYWLARPATAITVADVVRAVEGEIVSLHADGPDSWLWHRLGHTVAEFLEGWTVGDVDAGRARAAAR